MKLKIKNFENKETGEISLNKDIFGLPTRKDILSRTIEWQRAKKQSGNHKTKQVGEVSGTTKKPWAQKGTGRARAGSMRSTQFRGGGIIFGPVVRSHAYDLPKKYRKLALKTALSVKAKEGKLIIVDSIKVSKPKAKDMQAKFEVMGVKSALIIDAEKIDASFLKAIGNLKFIDALPQIGANVYDIIKHDSLIITEAAVKKLEERLAK